MGAAAELSATTPRNACSPASAAERRVLARVGALPNVRLACQLRPAGDIAVVPLMPASLSAQAAALQVGARHGQEREIAVLERWLADHGN